MCVQAVKEGRLRPSALQPDARMRRPGLATLVLDEADLMLSMPGYEEDLQAIAPLVRRPRQLTDTRLLQQRACCRPSGMSLWGPARSICCGKQLNTMLPQDPLRIIQNAIVMAGKTASRCQPLHMPCVQNLLRPFTVCRCPGDASAC